MSHEITACIFDLDGVIVDTAKYHYLAWRRLAEELGFEFTQEQNERLKGVSRMRSLEILMEIGGIQLSQEEQQEAAARKNQWYVQYIDEMDRSEILPGAEEFIEELRAAGVPFALGSASKNAMRILRRIELDQAFSAVIDGTKVSKAKPDPEVFLMAAGEMGIPAENCAVFEDAEAGIEAGLRGGMYTVGVGDPGVLHKAHRVIPGLHAISWSDLRSG